MCNTPRPDTDLHTLARLRAERLRREALDQAWSTAARLLRRAIPSTLGGCRPRDNTHAPRPATLWAGDQPT